VSNTVNLDPAWASSPAAFIHRRKRVFEILINRMYLSYYDEWSCIFPHGAEILNGYYNESIEFNSQI
jgi:hypothetical protein